MSPLFTLIQYSFGSPSHGNQRRKRNKKNPTFNPRGQTVTGCKWHDTLYIENPKNAPRNLLELIHELGKITWYKINTQKFLVFLYSNNDKSERKIQEIIPLNTASKRIKYLGINLSK